MRALRTIGAVLRAAAGLDRQQRRHLHRGRIEVARDERFAPGISGPGAAARTARALRRASSRGVEESSKARIRRLRFEQSHFGTSHSRCKTMKRIWRGPKECTQPLDWSHAIYHKGASKEDKTHGGMRSANEKAPRQTRGIENAAVTLMRELQLHRMPAAKALQWTILTAARASETLGATRSEIKSPSEFARLAKLPNHLVDGETWGCAGRTNEGGKGASHYLFTGDPCPHRRM